MKPLRLESRNHTDETFVLQSPNKIVMFTPPINESYWDYRVQLHEDQSVIGFGKFGTIGIGFAQESDWNTNLPYVCKTEDILNHIWHNHKYQAVTKKRTAEAIRLIQAQVELDHPDWPKANSLNKDF
jgi:hypothetical protein